MPETLGEYLSSARKRNGKTQVEIAKEVGVTRGNISQIELGQHASKKIDPGKLAKAYDVDKNVVIELSGDLLRGRRIDFAGSGSVDLLPLLRAIMSDQPAAINKRHLARLVSLYMELGSLSKDQIRKVLTKYSR